jgi:hypothetical protein
MSEQKDIVLGISHPVILSYQRKALREFRERMERPR